MRKKLLRCCIINFLFLFAGTQLSAQDFLGISTGNYAGITGVMLQPASIVDSRFKFDINLFSTGINYSNNYLLLDKDAILKFNKHNFDNYNTFKQKYLTIANLPSSEKVWFNVNNRTQVPLSFMATLDKKSAIALNIQSRSMVQGRNIPQEMARMAYSGFYDISLINTNINGSGFNLNTLNWAEVGLTYGRVLYSSEKHFLKAAFTGKYLAGIASLNVGSNDLTFRVNSDSSIGFNTTNFQYFHNEKADLNKLIDRRFNPDATAFGFDAGLVYEYRGNIDKFKYISRDDQNVYDIKERRDANKYMFKLGVSLLDAGMFTFDRPTNVNNFNANVNNWRVRNQHFNNINEFDTALANRVTQLPNGARQYNVYMPTALSVQLDIRFIKGFYLNAMSYTAVKIGSDEGYRFDGYNYYTITPRWESRHIGVYIPYTIVSGNRVDEYKGNRLGATLRLGPLFVGSSNLGSMLFNNHLKAADVHVGLKIGVTYGKPNKATKFFDNLLSKKNNENNYPYKSKDTVYVASYQNDSLGRKQLPLIVDYNTGKIYADPNKSGNIIIINNNYYYGNQLAKDSATYQNRMIANRDSILQTNDTLYKISNSDSVQRRWNDSLNVKKARLDSLIRKMEQLRKSMDTTNRLYRDTLKTIDKSNGNTSLFRRDSLRQSTAFANLNDTLQSVQNQIEENRQRLYNDSIALRQNIDNKILNSTKDNSKQYSPASKESIVLYERNKNQEQYNQQMLDQQDKNFDRYMDESNDLQREIRDLQNEISKRKNYYSDRTRNVPVYIPVGNSNTSTVIIRDTVYIKDTLHTRDTLTLTKENIVRDTLLKLVTIPASPVYVPITKEKVVTQKIDYSKLPAEVLLFAIGKADIKAIYYNKLDYIAGVLKNDSSLSASITGHTDNTGSVKLNQQLAIKRASAVKDYLSKKGVAEVQLEMDALPASKSVGKGKSSNSQERKVNIKIVAK